MRGAVRVVVPGLLTTVQDLGRFGYGELGVSPAGAADPLSLRIGNRLVGNDEGAAALEMTLVGGTFEFERPAVIALAGSDFVPRLEGAEVENWTPLEVGAGATLRLEATRDGARAYLCVRGGIEVPEILGSAATHLLVGIGGFGGRSLRAGDRLPVGERVASDPAPGGIEPDAVPGLLRRDVLRVTPGPQAGWFSRDEVAAFHAASYLVTETSNRMGIRLDGRSLRAAPARELLTEGVSPGAVQVPPDGLPIVLLVEHPATGGYPKIAAVASADFHALGQLRPRDLVRFEPVSLDDALALLREQEEALVALLG
ncbi:MAG: biotin-dependent carboxyltransferase family protein [Acidobacteriia bacterium]|nr:biotin-dependent carboxyltransferase family protein [Terriglobia bacterium]